MTLDKESNNTLKNTDFNIIISNFIDEEKWDDMISFIQKNMDGEENQIKLKNALNNNLSTTKQSNIYNHIDNIEILKTLIQLENDDSQKDKLIEALIDNVNKVANYKTNTPDIEISTINCIRRLVQSNILGEELSLELADKNIVKVDNFKYNHNLLLENIALDKNEIDLITGVLDDKIKCIQSKYSFLDKEITSKKELDKQKAEWDSMYNNIVDKANKSNEDLDIIKNKQLIEEYFTLMDQKISTAKNSTTKNFMSKAIDFAQTFGMAYESLKGGSSRSFKTNFTKLASIQFLLLTKLGDKTKVKNAFDKQEHLKAKQNFNENNKRSLKEIFLSVCLYIVKFFDVSGTRKKEKKLIINSDDNIKLNIKEKLNPNYIELINKNINLLNKNKETFDNISNKLTSFAKYSNSSMITKVNEYKSNIDDIQKQVSRLQKEQNNFSKSKNNLEELAKLEEKQLTLNKEITQSEKAINKQMEYYSFVDKVFSENKNSVDLPPVMYKGQINIENANDLQNAITKSTLLLSKYDTVKDNENFAEYKDMFEEDLKQSLTSINDFAKKENTKLTDKQIQEINKIKSYANDYESLHNVIDVQLESNKKTQDEVEKVANKIEKENIMEIADDAKKLEKIEKIQQGGVFKKIAKKFFPDDESTSSITSFLALLQATEYNKEDDVIKYFATQAVIEYQSLTDEVVKAENRIKLIKAQQQLQDNNMPKLINIEENGIFSNLADNSKKTNLQNELTTDIINLKQKTKEDENLEQIIILKNIMIRALIFDNKNIQENNITYCENYFSNMNSENVKQYSKIYQQEYNKLHQQFLALKNIIHEQQEEAKKQEEKQLYKEVQNAINTIFNKNEDSENLTPEPTPYSSFISYNTNEVEYKDNKKTKKSATRNHSL